MKMLGMIIVGFLLFCVAAAFASVFLWIMFWSLWLLFWVIGVMVHIGFWVIILAMIFGGISWLGCRVRDLFR